jgi:hypothetical protein
MNEKVASFFRFAGFGKTAKDLSDQEIIELYKRVKEQLQESNGEENPVLDSATPGPDPMGGDDLPDVGLPDESAPMENTETAPETGEQPPADSTGPIDSPELAPSEGSEVQPESTGDQSGEAYDPEQDKELQAMLQELGLGDDQAGTDNIGETGASSDAGGAVGPIKQEEPKPTEEPLQVNSAEQEKDLNMEDLKVMFGVTPQAPEQTQETKEAAVEPQQSPAPEVAPAPAPEQSESKDEVAQFLNTLEDGETKEQPAEEKPVEEKEASVAPTQQPAQEPLSQIADEFEVEQVAQPQEQPTVGEHQYFTSKTPNNIPAQPLDNKEVDISDFTIAGKGRIAMKGFQLCRKDKDTMADGITRPDHDEGQGIKPPRTDLQNPFGADFKKKEENRDTDLDSDKDLKVASIAEKVAFEFDTKEALDKYLDQHPKADRNNHWVDENQKAPNIENHPLRFTAPVTKQKAQNDAYKILGPSINGFFTDTDWSNIRATYKKLQDNNWKVDHLGVDDKDYRTDGGTKRWKMNLLHPSGRELTGVVTAYAAGTVKDPWSRYDMTFQMY